MKIGTYYYPEQWPRTQWARDFDNIQRLDLQIVHMAEFAWFAMEQEEGKINLDWLAECVELAAKRDLKVILCTPTAAPPVWLIEKHPEILPVMRDGQPMRFGGRRHYNPLVPAMVEASKRIVTAMADRFGNHPAVIGWQIDNEYSVPFDQSLITHQVFQAWLEDRYKTIDALNQAWGCQFWNTYYTDFSQILMPPSRDPEWANPHHRLDASRFWSWAFAQFNKVQADILKPRIGDRFITTNFMPLHPDANPGDFSGELSLFSWDAYPVAIIRPEETKDQTFRLADPNFISLMHDQMASYTGRWAQMELQPGQVNWTGTPVLLYPGAVRLWLWTAFAHNAEFVTTYRYRQPRFGVEMFHHGLVGTDGVTPTTGGREFTQTIGEIQRLDPKKLHAPAAPAPPAKGRAKSAPAVLASAEPTVGLYVDFEQVWYYATLPQAKRWNYTDLLTRLYGAAARLGQRIQVIRPGQPIPNSLKLLILPAVQMVDDTMVQSWKNYVAAGGNLLITCRTATMDRTGQFFEGPTASPILPLIGGTIEAYDSLPEGAFGKLTMGDEGYQWGTWADLLYAEESTRVLATYSDQFYAGAAAVMQKSHPGKGGTVTYCGVFPEIPFADALVEYLLLQMKLPLTPTPHRVHILRRGAYHICLNYQDEPYEIPAGRNAQFIVGSRRLEPADVAVWEEEGS
jgi:beta-galactosidase